MFPGGMIPRDIKICGVPDAAVRFAAIRSCAWPTRTVTWTITDKAAALADNQGVKAFLIAWDIWTLTCGIKPIPWDNKGQPNIRSDAGPLDGPQGTLGWSELPCGVDSVRQKYDSQERWTLDSNDRTRVHLPTVVAHELGHALGLPHSQNTFDIMYPTYQGPRSKPGPWETTELVARYGSPSSPAPPPPQPDDLLPAILDIFRRIAARANA